MTNYDEIIKKTKSGKALNLKIDSRFDSHVSDLGIGCESCHANGDKHIELNQNPIRKYYLHLSGNDDKSIINPHKLSSKKSMDICGQCHGQRTPKTYSLARQWMEKGPTYRPGDNLENHVNPVWQKSLINKNTTEIFKLRFWKDGTPRLSAYEYQGLLQSTCHIKGNLTCNDCHSMHEGDPKGMIKADMLTNKACSSCHLDISENLVKHTGHKVDSEGSLCFNCHMPKIVYGVMTFHRSHKIESPNPIAEFNNDKPNACTSCHIDKSSEWTYKQSLKIWPNIKYNLENNLNTSIHSLYKLHSGDPVERAIAAYNFSYQNGHLNSNNKHFLLPHLLFALDDSYPAIRRFSYKSLTRLLDELLIENSQYSSLVDTLENYDFIADKQLRDTKVKQAWIYYGQLNKSNWQSPPTGSFLNEDYKLDIQSLITLREISLEDNKLIDIGE